MDDLPPLPSRPVDEEIIVSQMLDIETASGPIDLDPAGVGGDLQCRNLDHSPAVIKLEDGEAVVYEIFGFGVVAAHERRDLLGLAHH